MSNNIINKELLSYDSENEIYDENFEFSQLKHKKENQFKFEPFEKMLSNVKIRFNENLEKNYYDTIKEKKLHESEFNNNLDIQFSINKNYDFVNYYNEIKQYCLNFLEIVKNYKNILNILKREIEKEIKNKKFSEIYINLNLIVYLIKDIRDEGFKYFIENNFEQIINLIKYQKSQILNFEEFNLINNIFIFFVNIFQLFQKSIKKDFLKFFIIYSDLLFNQNKFIRKFSIQSIVFLIKNFDEENIKKIFNFLFDFILNPEKILDINNNNDNENNNNNENNFEEEKILSKKIINKLIEKDNNINIINIKFFICDCLSELIYEILMNNNILSFKSDLILLKIKGIKEIYKNKIEILLIFVEVFIKISKKIKDKNNKNNIEKLIILFHFFIFNFYINDYNENNYKKFELNNINEIIINNKNYILNNNLIYISLLLFNKELLLKNFKETKKLFSNISKNFFNEDFNLNFDNNNNDYYNLIINLKIDILNLNLKFHSNNFFENEENNFIKILNNEKNINNFLFNLKELNNFYYFKNFSIYNRKNYLKEIKNDEFDLFSYDKILIEKILNEIIEKNEIKINFELLFNFFNVYENIFNENFTLILNDKIKIFLNEYFKNKINFNLNDLNKNNYEKTLINIKLSNLIINKSFSENICKDIINFFNQFNNISLTFEEKFNFVFFIEFYNENDLYLNKFQAFLNIIKNNKNFFSNENKENYLKFINNNFLFNFGIFYEILLNNNNNKNFNEDFILHNNHIILLSKNNKYKLNYIKIFQKNFIRKFNEFYNKYFNILNDIFNTIYNILNMEFDYLNDKKYSLNFEIIFSKFELLFINEGLIYEKFLLLNLILKFFIGNFWIFLTKNFWPVLNNLIKNIFEILLKSIEIEKYENFEKDFFDFILNFINNLLKYIQKNSNEDFFISKNYFKINNEFYLFKSKNNLNNSNKFYENFKSISTFFNGILVGLQSFYLILNNNNLYSNFFITNCFFELSENFLNENIKKLFININNKDFNKKNIDIKIDENYFENVYLNNNKKENENNLLKLKEEIKIIKKNENEINYLNLIDETKDFKINDSNYEKYLENKIDLCILFNYLTEKESKNFYSTTILTLKETILIILSNTENLLNSLNKEKIIKFCKIILFEIINCRSLIIQKIIIEILSKIDFIIKKNKELLLKSIENSNVLLENININEKIKNEFERKNLIKILIRIYFSKNYKLKVNNNEKKKIKNKINLINFFIQLNQNEFNEYLNILLNDVNIIFINNNFQIINLRNLNKILEILKLNLKQITNLFHDEIFNISYKIFYILIYLKKLNEKFKNNNNNNEIIIFIKKNLFFNSFIKNNFNEEEFKNFEKFMFKNIKSIKKECFNILIMIFNQFYKSNLNLLNNLSTDIIKYYNNNLIKKTNKINSIFKFFISLSKHSQLHFIYAKNPIIFNSILNLLKNKEIENSFIIIIMNFIQNLLSAFSFLNNENNNNNIIINNENENIKITQMEIDSDSSNENLYKFNKNDNKIDNETLKKNFNEIIENNLFNITESLNYLIINQKLSLNINNKKTLVFINIYLDLFSLLFNNNNNEKKIFFFSDKKIHNVEIILNFILNLCEKKNIFYSVYEENLSDIIILLNYLIKIKLLNKKNDENEKILNLYKNSLKFFILIENIYNRFLFSNYLKNFSLIDKKLEKIFEILIELNSLNKNNRNLDKNNLNVDFIIEKLNEINNEDFINENLLKIEPIVFQLLFLAKNKNDFSLIQTSKEILNKIFFKISLLNFHNKFNEMINIFFYLIYEKFEYAKIILENIFYQINIKISSNFTCEDLNNFLIIKETENENFFLNILAFKFEYRIQALKILKLNINKISKFSITKIILPIIKNFLDFNNYDENINNNNKNFVVNRNKNDLNEIINLSIDLIPEIIKIIDSDEIEKFLEFFYKNIKILSKNKNKDNQFYSIDIFKVTNLTLSKILECIIQFKFKSNFDEIFDKISKNELNEKINDFYLNLNEFDNNNKNDNENLMKNKLNSKEFFDNIYEKFNNEYKSFEIENYNEIYNINNNNQIEMEIENENKEENDKMSIDDNNNNNNFESDFFNSNYNFFTKKISSNKNNLFSIYLLIKNKIYPTLKSLLFNSEKKSKKKYFIRNHIITPFLQTIKIINPENLQSSILELLLELLVNLKNFDNEIRLKSYEGIKLFLNNINEIYLILFYENLSISFKSGFQRHVLGYSINILVNLTKNNKIIEISLKNIVPVLIDEIFGDLNEEKNVENLMNKYSEIKNSKALITFEKISEKISIVVLMNSIIIPIKNYLILRKNTSENNFKLNNLINVIIRGLKNNEKLKGNFKEIFELMDYSFMLIEIGIKKGMKEKILINELKNVQIKGNINKIDFNDEDNKNKNDIINENDIFYSNIFCILGLEFLLVLFSKKIIDVKNFEKLNIKELELNSEENILNYNNNNNNNNYSIEIKEIPNNIKFNFTLFKKLNNILPNVIISLSISNDSIILSNSIKIILNCIDFNFLIIKKNIEKIIKNLFKLLLNLNPSNINLCQNVLTGISKILSKFKFIKINDLKIKKLINFLKIYISNIEIQNYILIVFLTLIKNKIIHPEIYEMIENLKENYLKNSSKNFENYFYDIYFNFLNFYPLEKKAVINHLNFFIANLESKSRLCKLNSIKMLKYFIENKFYGINENFDFIIMKIFTVYFNSEDSEIKKNILNGIIQNLVKNYDKNLFENYWKNSLEIIEKFNNNENNTIIVFSLNIISILLNFEFDFVNKNKNLIKIFENLLNFEIKNFEKKINNNNNNNNNNNIEINLNNSEISFLYSILICIDKINLNYNIKLNQNIFHKIIYILNHPHNFIKSICLKIINENIFKIKITLNDFNLILNQINFIFISSNNYEEKIYKNSENILFQFFNNKNIYNDFFDNNNNENIKNIIENKLLNFLQELVNNSKKWISNKNIGIKILNRIINIFEKIIDNKNLKEYYKPIIELSYRITNNINAESNIKKQCEEIFEKIGKKMDSNKFNEIYKDVIKNINYLKQKRKREKLEKYKENLNKKKDDKKILNYDDNENDNNDEVDDNNE